jgi:hypothetical protein
MCFTGPPHAKGKGKSKKKKKAQEEEEEEDPKARKTNWDLFRMEHNMLKVAVEGSRGVLYFLAVPLPDGKWVLR